MSHARCTSTPQVEPISPAKQRAYLNPLIVTNCIAHHIPNHNLCLLEQCVCAPQNHWLGRAWGFGFVEGQGAVAGLKAIHETDKLTMLGHRQPRQLIWKVEVFDNANRGLQHQHVTNVSTLQQTLGIQSLTALAAVLM